MKRILLVGLLLISFLSGCQKENEIAPEERPDARLNKILSDYKTQLVSAPYGWKAVLYPASGAGYSLLINFAENDRLSMTSDINAATAATALESTYRLKAMQTPSLLFDTYSYLHILSDPDATVSGGDWGAGKYSDFEFTFESVTAETITLKGNLQGSRLVLTKATQDESSNFIARAAATATLFQNINTFTTYFKRLTAGSTVLDVATDTDLRTITFNYLEGGATRTFTTSYYYTENGIMLLTPFVNSNFTITGFSDLQYSTINHRFNLTVNNAPATIQEASRPAAVDVQAARNFYNTAENDYWVAETGFTVNGEVDALKVSEITDFSFLTFWPRFGSSGNNTYDLLGFIVFNQAENQAEIGYGPAATQSITNDGRIIYNYIGDLGTVPAADLDKVTATREIWTDPQGFYVVPVDESTIDLVSAKDAKSWIRLYH